MNIKDLAKLGMSEAEAIIYYSVLKLKTCTVKQISKESGFHRTNIYDVLEQLKEKGLVSYFQEGKVMKYSPSSPSSFYELINEKKELLDTFFPELKKLYESTSEEIKVEILKGNEGMKTAWRDMIKENKPLYGFGVKGQLREKIPIFADQFLRDLKHFKIPYYGVYTKRGNNPSYYTEIRYVSEELSGPVATFIYGNKVNINIWEPSLVCIIIHSKLVADMYKKHFDLLWKVAKK
jgi:predicted transcriptional regulator